MLGGALFDVELELALVVFEDVAGGAGGVDEGVDDPRVPMLERMLSHLLFGKLMWFSVWSIWPNTPAVVDTSESEPFLSVESCDRPVIRQPPPMPFSSVIRLLTSQNMLPPSPLEVTYCALSDAMCGVSYETSSFLALSYEYEVTSVRFSTTCAPASGSVL